MPSCNLKRGSGNTQDVSRNVETTDAKKVSAQEKFTLSYSYKCTTASKRITRTVYKLGQLACAKVYKFVRYVSATAADMKQRYN